MKFFWTMLLLAYVLMSGCSPKPFRIKLEVYINPKGSPHFRWEQVLLYETKVSGIVSQPDGAVLEGTFRQSEKSDPVKIKLNLHIDSHDLLTAEGDSQSPQDYEIYFDGMTKEVTPTIQVKAGENKIKFSGTLYKVYEN